MKPKRDYSLRCYTQKMKSHRVQDILKIPTPPQNGDLSVVIDEIYGKRDKFLEVAKKFPTPFYVIDVPALEKSIAEFKAAFKKNFPACRYYYAVKSNHHPFILKKVVEAGFGLDVSSGRELLLALATQCETIVFSGPGKTEQELLLALTHASRVTVHIDSPSELRRLEHLAATHKRKVRAGIRVFSAIHGTWSKFGISITELKKFWLTAKKSKYVDLQGIQFHLSWNLKPDKYVVFIKELGTYLKQNFTPQMRKQIKFIDMGGGYFPDSVEGYYPWTTHYPGTLPLGHIIKSANTYYGEETTFKEKYYIIRSEKLPVFAKQIRAAVEKYLKPIINAEYYTEPGRVICTKAMHIVVRVLDKKQPGSVITDGGVNIAGWEYGEHFYYPTLNLTHPSKTKEIPCTLFGPLCTPHDMWGYYCYAKKVEEGDLIVIPNQGAYRYVLSQRFIKEIPEVHFLE